MLLVLLLLFSLSWQDALATARIHGQFHKLSHGQVILESYLFGPPTEVARSQIAEDGHFAFDFDVKQIGFYRISCSSPEYSGMESRYINLVIDSTNVIGIEASAPEIDHNYTVQGSEDSKLLKNINDILKRSFDRLDSLDAQYNLARKRNSLHMDSLSRSFQGPYLLIVNQREDFIRDIILDNPSSLSILTIINYLDKDEDLDAYQVMDKNLYKRYPTLPYVSDFHRKVQEYSRIAIGAKAPEIELFDSKNEAFKLSDQKGKLVLLEFWSSENTASRLSHQTIQDIQKTHRKDAFIIVSVSFDEKKDTWLKAIQEDRLRWTQVSDFNGWSSAYTKVYDVRNLPTYYLIDEDGRILEKGFGVDTCEAKIQAHLLKVKNNH